MVLTASVAFVALASVGSTLDRTATRTETSIVLVQRALGVPLEHLEGTLRLEMAGETALQRAAATTGGDRNRFLAESIAAAEATTNMWTRYKEAALGLPGESEIAARYERDYAAGKDVAAEILVPIIQSATPAALPDAQVTAADQNRRNLAALVDLYHEREASELARLEERVSQAKRVLASTLQGAVAAVLLATALGLRLAGRAAATRRRRMAEADTATFEGQLIRALELARVDDDALQVAAMAAARAAPSAEVTIAAIPVGGVTLVPLAGPLVCEVDDPARCPALRAGSPLEFSDSTSLDTCPVLAASGHSPCAVTCWPISVGGSDAALLQAVQSVDDVCDSAGEVGLVARRVGERLTIMRAFARFELQASRDALTGLLNRRSLEDAVAQLEADGIDYCVAFADIDHFKRLNDEQGHDAGDRALKAVARTMRDSLRPHDVLCRWGGEEFVIVLPDCGQRAAVAAMDRMRAHLASAGRDGREAGVTVSVGVAEWERGDSFELTVTRADEALLAAKSAGRDRVLEWVPGIGSSAVTAFPRPTVVPG